MFTLPARIALGFSRHPLRFLLETGVAFAAGWSLIEPMLAFFPKGSVAGWPHFLTLAALAVAVGVARVTPADSKTANIPGTTSRLTISYRDLFAESGIIAVPVNEFFDSSIGAHVSPLSVHGQVITQLFGGDSERFDKAVDAALTSATPELVVRRSGRDRKYPVGTTAYLTTGRPSVLAFVLTATDLTTLKVSADVPQMWTALDGLWRVARTNCNDAPLAVPLVGSGLAGVGLSPQELLSVIVMSAAAASRQRRICANIHICILPQQRSRTSIEAALSLIT
jgi:hypothetical protein